MIGSTNFNQCEQVSQVPDIRERRRLRIINIPFLTLL